MEAKARGQKGFSLVEILVGMFIFSIGMLGVIALMVATIRGQSQSGRFTEAIQLATNRVERIMMLDYDHADLTDKQSLGQPGYGEAGLASKNAATADGTATGLGRNGAYTIYWNVAEDTPMNHCKTIEAWVVWQLKGNEYALNVTTVKTGVM